ncbi:MAG: glycosyltransferase family 2 protein, partial [Patescibacteria group bacterium]
KKIRYYYSKIPSLTRARNIGAKYASRGCRIVLFLDDDVSLDSGYFAALLDVFNEYAEAKGVAGYYFSPERSMSRVEKKLRNLFFIEHVDENCAKVLSAYGAVYPDQLTHTIRAMWMPGFNMAFKKEIFDELQFDENLSRYALAEDFDFTYRLYKKYPDSLFMTPRAMLIHRVSAVERYPTEKAAYMNQIHHFYLHFKNFNSVGEKLRFVWCLTGIFLLRVLQLLRTRSQGDYLKLLYFLQSTLHCLANLDKIKKGRLKEIYLST